MELVVIPQLAFLAVAGIVGGLSLLIRGFGAYRAAGLIEGTSTSTVASLAVGEVRVSGGRRARRAIAHLAPPVGAVCLLPVDDPRIEQPRQPDAP